MDASTSAGPTWKAFSTSLTEGTRTWLPDKLVTGLQTYLKAAGGVFFILLASSPPGVVIDTAVQANRVCRRVCVEGVEALGGLDLGNPCSKSVLELTRDYRPMFETIIAPMSAPVVASVVAKYDGFGPLLATMTKAQDIQVAHGVLRMLTACNHSIVEEIARKDIRWRGDGIGGGVGTPGWKRAQARWAATGKWEPDGGGRPGPRRS